METKYHRLSDNVVANLMTDFFILLETGLVLGPYQCRSRDASWGNILAARDRSDRRSFRDFRNLSYVLPLSLRVVTFHYKISYCFVPSMAQCTGDHKLIDCCILLHIRVSSYL